MKTKQELATEISILKERLSKAIIFELTEDISIGMSESDGKFRIRREEPDGNLSFLGKQYQWELQPIKVDSAYSQLTGYDTAEEAFEMFELLNNYGYIDASESLKNN